MIETDMLKVRLEKLLKCKININQVTTFIEEAKVLNMDPMDALDLLEKANLDEKEIKKIKKGKRL
jgi:hypothetical protein